MKNYIKKYLFLVGRLSSGYFLLVLMFLLTALLDFIGIGLIGPFIGFAIEGGGANTFSYFSGDVLNLDFNTVINRINSVPRLWQQNQI